MEKGDAFRKVVIISESTADDLKLTRFKFNFYVLKFIRELKDDPVNTVPADILQMNGLDRKRLINILLDNGMLRRKARIRDKDADGNPCTAVMSVQFGDGPATSEEQDGDSEVPRSGFKKKLRHLYDTLFKDARQINETDCASVGGDQGFGYTAPFGPVVTQGSKKKKDPSLTRPKGDVACNKSGK